MKNTDYVLEVYRTGSFTAAAANLYMSQPALSTAVRKIETELGVEIFDRSTSPVHPTGAGMVYIRALQEMQTIRINMQNELNDLAGLRTGQVALGGAHFISAHLFPEVLIAYARQYPGIHIDMTEGSSLQLQEQLLNEKIDLVLDYGSDPELLESEALFSETILLTLPLPLIPDELRGAALTRQDILEGRHLTMDCPVADISRFREVPFLLLKKGNDMNRRAMKICRGAGFQPQVLIYLDQMMTSYTLAQLGMGAAFVTDTVIRLTVPDADALFFRIDSAPLVRTLFITWKKSRYVPLAAREFIRIARETLSGAGTVRKESL